MPPTEPTPSGLRFPALPPSLCVRSTGAKRRTSDSLARHSPSLRCHPRYLLARHRCRHTPRGVLGAMSARAALHDTTTRVERAARRMHAVGAYRGVGQRARALEGKHDARTPHWAQTPRTRSKSLLCSSPFVLLSFSSLACDGWFQSGQEAHSPRPCVPSLYA